MAIKNSVLLGEMYNRAISEGILFKDICQWTKLSRTVVNKILNKGWHAKHSTLNVLRMYFLSVKFDCHELNEIISMYKKKDRLIELIKETQFNDAEISRMEEVINFMLLNDDAGDDDNDA